MVLRLPRLRQNLISALRDLAAVSLQDSDRAGAINALDDIDFNLEGQMLFERPASEAVGRFLFDAEEARKVDEFSQLYDRVARSALEKDREGWLALFPFEPDFPAVQAKASELAKLLEQRVDVAEPPPGDSVDDGQGAG